MSILLNNVRTSGTLTAAEHKAKFSNAQFVMEDNGEIVVKNCKIEQASYNVFEIGMNSEPTKVEFLNCEFGDISNNAILIHGTAENAEVVLKNCKFAKLSNALRFSNRTNAKNVHVLVEDCEVEQWDLDPIWAGFLMCQDFSSKTQEEVEEANRFGPDKLIITFKNLKHKGQVILPENLADVCATKDANTQVMYITFDHHEDEMPGYRPDIFPTMTFEA